MGVTAGIFMTGLNKLVQSVLFGVSAGTFIYIASTEIIVEEFTVTKHPIKKFIAYILGCSLMLSMYYIDAAMGGD